MYGISSSFMSGTPTGNGEGFSTVLICIRFLSAVNCFTTLVASGTYDSFPTMLTSISLPSSVMPFMTVMPTGTEGFFNDA